MCGLQVINKSACAEGREGSQALEPFVIKVRWLNLERQGEKNGKVLFICKVRVRLKSALVFRHRANKDK